MSLTFPFSNMAFSKRAMFSLCTGSLILWSAYASVPNTGLCETFAVHAGLSITFADDITITNGDVGYDSLVGPAYVLVDGDVASPEDPAAFANSVQAAWVAAMEPRPDGNAMAMAEIGGQTFTPGTWRSDTINIAAYTTVTLDGQNDTHPVFLFQAATTLLTGVGCKIILTNGAKAEHVLWALGTTFTTGTETDFQGSILAGAAITVGASNTMHGSLVARTVITFGAKNQVDGCVVALGDITFGTENHVTVPQPEVAPLTTVCGSDVILLRQIGATNYTDNPISIIPQSMNSSNNNDEVTFQISQEWMTGDLSHLFVRFQDQELAITKCYGFENRNATWKSEPFAASCTRGSKIAFVEVWASDTTFHDGSDMARLHPDCSGDDSLPTVKYVFQVECVSACAECPSTHTES
jgi:hypothetical protein